MEFTVIFKDNEGRDTVVKDPFVSETAAKQFVKRLVQSGLKAEYISREPKKWQLAKVVFDLQKVKEAKRAIAAGKDLPGVIYTFGDAGKYAVIDKLVDVECFGGHVKTAYCVDLVYMTAEEINAFKAKIGYEHLGLTKAG